MQSVPITTNVGSSNSIRNIQWHSFYLFHVLFSQCITNSARNVKLGRGNMLEYYLNPLSQSIPLQKTSKISECRQRSVVLVEESEYQRKPLTCWGLSWGWSYCNWIYNCLCNQCLSPLKLWVQIPLRRGYLIQHYVIKFVSDLRQVSGFL
jgi:hypothetical protein